MCLSRFYVQYLKSNFFWLCFSVLDTNDRFLRKITVGQANTEKGRVREVREPKYKQMYVLIYVFMNLSVIRMTNFWGRSRIFLFLFVLHCEISGDLSSECPSSLHYVFPSPFPTPEPSQLKALTTAITQN